MMPAKRNERKAAHRAEYGKPYGSGVWCNRGFYRPITVRKLVYVKDSAHEALASMGGVSYDIYPFRLEDGRKAQAS